MKKFAITTDTNSGITAKEATELDIHMVPMPFFIDGKTYLEDVDITKEEFYVIQEQGAEISTSLPSPGDLISLWDKLLITHEAILHIPMSSRLSNSCEAAQTFAKSYNGRVQVVDNRRISITLHHSVIKAVKLRQEGFGVEKVKEVLELESTNGIIYVSVGNLTYLKKGGRVSPSMAAIGNLLNLKPILYYRGEELDAIKKVRGIKNAKNAMVEAIQHDLDNTFKDLPTIISVAYSGDYNKGMEWKEMVQKAFPNHEITCDELPVSVVCHVGPDTFVVGIIADTQV